jgi:hypothetical protein
MGLIRFLFLSVSIALPSSLLTLLTQQAAIASFTCGPYLETYSVRSQNGTSGRGVRCVRFNVDSDSRRLIWYGEGYWGATRYRHIGERFADGTANAGDISGNGEDTNGVFLGSLRLRLSAGNPPRIITVTGAWDETWVLQRDNIVQRYTSRLEPVDSCGGLHFATFEVRDAARRRSGEGIRCVLQPVRGGVWYGAGDWNGFDYAHIGTGALDDSPDGMGAFDICEPSKFDFCNIFRQGLLEERDVPGKPPSPRCIAVSGAWNEIWELINPASRFDAICF